MAPIYATMSYVALQGRDDVAIRFALGASPYAAVRFLVTSGARLAVSGIAVGWVFAAVAGKTLQPMFFRVGPGDPPSVAAAAGLVVMVVLVTLLLPARALLRTDMAAVLRR